MHPCYYCTYSELSLYSSQCSYVRIQLLWSESHEKWRKDLSRVRVHDTTFGSSVDVRFSFRPLSITKAAKLTNMFSFLVLVFVIFLAARETCAFRPLTRQFIQIRTNQRTIISLPNPLYKLLAKSEVDSEDIDETTKKYGLEAGLLKAAQSKGENSKVQATDLLKKYGVAYLATSISLAIVSYTLCYFLVANGIDVAALLEKVGIKATSVASNAGTAGIAYAIHKAASPIRFPPTVALTPIVANWLGKSPSEPAEK
jgi:hypothetical protein